MKRGTLFFLVVIALSWTVAAPSRVSAQSAESKQHTRYKLVDLGTLGGPSSGIGSGITSVNQRGIVAAGAATAERNPQLPNFSPFIGPTEFVGHAVRWKDGVLNDLGTLPGGVNSGGVSVNAHGDIVGISENGEIDPLTGLLKGFGVLWRNGKIINLGTLGGNQSFAIAINNKGQVVGIAENDAPDPLGFVAPGATQARAFLWEHGTMRDLGTLGGPDALASFLNERGQVAGGSFREDLSIGAFLWEDGKMTDLGSLGGTFAGASALNNRGQVAGDMTLAGDVTTHAFLWMTVFSPT